jgi:hypothetical protein
MLVETTVYSGQETEMRPCLLKQSFHREDAVRANNVLSAAETI